ncbi:hypothetical protein ABE10_01355 [Bacillus toyonensis]|nr:hypothetical protein [Bacillus toyonensis]
MTEALVGADLDLAADVGRHLTAKVTLHLVVGLDVVAERDELVVAEVLHTDRLIDLGGLEDLHGAGTANAVDVGEGDHHALVARDVDAGKTCHAILLSVDGGVEQDRCPGLRPEVSPAVRSHEGAEPAGSDPACVRY